jgi:hypothetical protein
MQWQVFRIRWSSTAGDECTNDPVSQRRPSDAGSGGHYGDRYDSSRVERPARDRCRVLRADGGDGVELHLRAK